MQPCPRSAEFPSTIFKYDTPHWGKDKTCSYCGSMSPEFLFEAIELGCEIGPTDKDYKIYVNVTKEVIEKNPSFSLPGGMPKFYFQHFDRENAIKFIDLYNEGKINMPNNFYVFPYFMVPVDRT